MCLESQYAALSTTTTTGSAPYICNPASRNPERMRRPDPTSGCRLWVQTRMKPTMHLWRISSQFCTKTRADSRRKTLVMIPGFPGWPEKSKNAENNAAWLSVSDSIICQGRRIIAAGTVGFGDNQHYPNITTPIPGHGLAAGNLDNRPIFCSPAFPQILAGDSSDNSGGSSKYSKVSLLLLAYPSSSKSVALSRNPAVQY